MADYDDFNLPMDVLASLSSNPSNVKLPDPE